jgi:thiol:disulfide interchange protein
MKSKILKVFIFVITIGMSSQAQSLFSNMSYADAVKTAKKENKSYFVDLTASWCLPCKLMDQTVFQDQMVIQYVEEQYIAVQLDVEDFDAMILKSEYQVKSLPTILFFNANGKMIAKEEGLQTGTNFLKLLKQYDSN